MQPTLFEKITDPIPTCPDCGDAMRPLAGQLENDWRCPNCENERTRMEEFDRLIEGGLADIWYSFKALCDDKVRAGALRLSAMPMLYEARRLCKVEVSNDHGPMMARKFNQTSGHPYFKTHRLKGG